MRVLLLRLGAFGDIIHTLPLAHDLAAAGHQVGWLCEDRWADLLRGSPAIHRLHLLPRRLLRTGPWLDRMRVLRGLVRELRGSYDAAIDAQGLAKSAVLLWLAGASLRIGHRPPRARELSWLAVHRQEGVTEGHIIDQQRSLAGGLAGRPCGPWRFPLPAWEAERRWAETWLAEQKLERPWLLNVGAGWPTKIWPQERQIAFARLVLARGEPVLLLWGSPSEQAAAEVVATGAPGARLAPATGIPRLAGLIAAGRVLVSGDTGPLHLGLALGTPSIGLFGPVPAWRNGPVGLRHRCFQAPGAAWERRDVSKVDMGAIRPEEVLAAGLEIQA